MFLNTWEVSVGGLLFCFGEVLFNYYYLVSIESSQKWGVTQELTSLSFFEEKMILQPFRRLLVTSLSPKIIRNSTLRVPARITQFSQHRKMNVSAIDSRIFRSLFGTEEIRNVSLISLSSIMLSQYEQTSIYTASGSGKMMNLACTSVHFLRNGVEKKVSRLPSLGF